MSFSPERLDRFARHIVLPQIGGAGQFALAQAHVAIVGLGGIGSPALQYLAAAGIGRLTLIDDGAVEPSNLQRQTIYAERDVGHGKAVSARRWLANFDGAIAVTLSDRRIDPATAPALLEGADLIVDGTDNFATRLAVSDAAVALGVPLVSAAVGRFQGHVGAFAGHRAEHACYRCFVGDAFDADDCDTCADDGMLGAMAGWTGTFAALQSVRAIVSPAMGDPQWGTLHTLDGLAPAMRSFRIAKDPACRACGHVHTAEGNQTMTNSGKRSATTERRSDREMVVTRAFAAPASAVFDAWSKPDLFRRWWIPQSSGMELLACMMDVRTGGTYRLEIKHPAVDRPLAFFGTYSEVVPSERIVWTNDETPDGAVTTVTFAAQGAETLVTVSELYPTKEALDTEIAGGASGALPGQLDQLDEMLGNRG